MKNLILILCLTIASNSFASELVCAKKAPNLKRLYPYNDAAIQFAAKLNLKTCDSDRFREVAKAEKHTGRFITVSQADLAAARLKLNKILGNSGVAAGSF